MAILLISKIKQANDGKFALVEAEDVEMPNKKRLSDMKFVSKTSELENDSNFMTLDEIKDLLQSGMYELLLQTEISSALDYLHEPITQAEYEALVQAGTVDPNKYYYIKKGE